MKKFFKKPLRWAITYSVVLAAFTVFVMLDTFVIPKEGKKVEIIDFSSLTGTSAAPVTSTTAATTSKPAESTTPSGSTDDTTSTEATTTEATTTEATTTEKPPVSVPVITENSYKDDNISIEIKTVRQYDTQMYIADIKISSVEYLKTALAKNTYGRNIRQRTSDMAEEHNAIFAINGDYYGFRDFGYVIRNGVLYRETPGYESAFAIFLDGTMASIDLSETSAKSLYEQGAYQVLSFGPTILENSEILIDKDYEIGIALSSNPRTAIGMVEPLHYVAIVSDGRTSESAGLSLYELASIFRDNGCTLAYNLDGGGSATMWFNGKVLNVLTDGENDTERKVSDIVYFGYEY